MSPRMAHHIRSRGDCQITSCVRPLVAKGGITWSLYTFPRRNPTQGGRLCRRAGRGDLLTLRCHGGGRGGGHPLGTLQAVGAAYRGGGCGVGGLSVNWGTGIGAAGAVSGVRGGPPVVTRSQREPGPRGPLLYPAVTAQLDPTPRPPPSITYWRGFPRRAFLTRWHLAQRGPPRAARPWRITN